MTVKDLEKMAPRKGVEVDYTLESPCREWDVEMAPDTAQPLEVVDVAGLQDYEDLWDTDKHLYFNKTDLVELMERYLGMDGDEPLDVKISAVQGKITIEAVNK